jgi:hypothetical protein
MVDMLGLMMVDMLGSIILPRSKPVVALGCERRLACKLCRVQVKSTSNLRKAGKDKTGWLKPNGSLWQKSREFRGRPEGEVNQGWL